MKKISLKNLPGIILVLLSIGFIAHKTNYANAQNKDSKSSTSEPKIEATKVQESPTSTPVNIVPSVTPMVTITPTNTVTPEISPTVIPAITPTVVPEPTAVMTPEVSPTPEKTWDSSTPKVLNNRLQLGIGASFGKGSSTYSGYSSDKLGFFGSINYLILPITTSKNLILLGGMRYQTYTGTYIREDFATGNYDVNVATQLIGLSAGVQLALPAEKRLRFVGNIIAGATMERVLNLRDEVFEASKYGFAGGGELKVMWKVYSKIDAVSGFTYYAGKWYGLDLGVMTSF